MTLVSGKDRIEDKLTLRSSRVASRPRNGAWRTDNEAELPYYLVCLLDNLHGRGGSNVGLFNPGVDERNASRPPGFSAS